MLGSRESMVVKVLMAGERDFRRTIHLLLARLKLMEPVEEMQVEVVAEVEQQSRMITDLKLGSVVDETSLHRTKHCIPEDSPRLQPEKRKAT